MNNGQQAMISEKIKDRKIIELKIDSPIHIGAKEGSLSRLEYLYFNNHTYLIDEDRFGRLIQSKQLIDLFVQEVREGSFRMREFIENRSQLNLQEALSQITKLRIEGGEQRMGVLRPFVRDGQGNLFIPGTSLKGVLRTALLYSILKSNDSLRREIIDRTLSGLDKLKYTDQKAKKKFSEDWLQKKLLQEFILPGGKAGPQEDILRCLTIRDTYPLAQIRTKIIKLQVMAKDNQGKYYWSCQKKQGRIPLEIWVEAILNGSFQCELLWDKKLFREFHEKNPTIHEIVKDLPDLLTKVKEWSKDLIIYERNYFLKENKTPINRPPITIKSGDSNRAENAADSLHQWYTGQSGDQIRLGFGSGMLATTIGLLFDEPLRQKIRNLCGYNRQDDPAPKSKRIWHASNNNWKPLGWVGLHNNGAAPEKSEVTHERNKDPEAPRTKMIAPKAPQKKCLEPEKVSLQVYLNQLSISAANDKILMDRMVKALNSFEDERDTRALAKALQEKLEKAGTWKKHALRNEIEQFLSEPDEE